VEEAPYGQVRIPAIMIPPTQSQTLPGTRAGITRLIEAYQEQLISLDELRTRMPPLRHREAAIQTQLAALEAELLDADTYLALAESLEGFLAKLHVAAQSLGVPDRQRVLRLVVKEVQVGPDTIVIKHSIPLPDHDPRPGYLLRTWRHDCRNAQYTPVRLRNRVRCKARGPTRYSCRESPTVEGRDQGVRRDREPGA
jgi:hypothetical protein